MQSKTLMLLSAAVLATAACSKQDNAANNMAANDMTTDANMMADNGMANDTAAVSPLTAQGFANAAAASDKFEIESSKLAASQASSAAVKSFATKMISAHTDSTAKLKSTLSGMSPAMTPDDTLTAEQQSTLDSLKGQNGAAFDSAYAAAQTTAHQKTLDTLKNYSASGDNAQLKSFADGLIPTVTAHLNMAKGLK
jgi:putative membrane protein